MGNLLIIVKTKIVETDITSSSVGNYFRDWQPPHNNNIIISSSFLVVVTHKLLMTYLLFHTMHSDHIWFCNTCMIVLNEFYK